MKTGIMFLALLLSANFIFAQSLDEGKSFMYYERYKSAKDVFQKLLAANPNNEEAAYWLGQAYIAPDDRSEKDLADAKALYQSKLTTNPNSPLLIAGMGHIELIEGKKEDARRRFETAISLSQGKSIPVLNAIGFANGNPDSKNGDAAYAVDKLKLATQIKKFNDPDVYANLGDAYRKFADGGNAIQAYEAALAINPKYARATYRIGKVYQTQGPQQESIFMKYYNDAIAMDPKYAPVYNNLFSYFYETNVGRAAEYLDKWLANSDDDPKACYYRASVKYAQGLFNEAISKADECITAGGATPYANLYGLKALSYNRLKDSLNAKNSFEEYFKRQAPEKIGGGDYAAYATVLLKFPGSETKAEELIAQAVKLDTVIVNHAAYYKLLGQAFEAQKNTIKAAEYYGKVVAVKKAYSNVDLFNAGYNYYINNAFDSSNKFFNMYVAKFPSDILGYYMLGNAAAVIDSTGALGTAVPYYQKTVEIGEADPTKPNAKSRLMNAYKFFVGYYYNAKKNRDSALAYVDKALALDPTDASMISNKEFISKNDPNKKPSGSGTNKATPTPPQPPKTTGTTGTTVNSKGEKVTIAADGTITTVEKDGTTSIVTTSGKVTTIKNGVTTVIENGKITTTGKDGKTTTVPATPAKPDSTKGNQ